MYQDDLLQSVATIATNARRNQPGSQRAREEAMKLLRRFGGAGQHAIQMALRQGGALASTPPTHVPQGYS